MHVVQGGGFEFLTADPAVIAVVRGCAELDANLRDARRREVARFRSLRRDVKRIEQVVGRPAFG